MGAVRARLGVGAIGIQVACVRIWGGTRTDVRVGARTMGMVRNSRSPTLTLLTTHPFREEASSLPSQSNTQIRFWLATNS